MTILDVLRFGISAGSVGWRGYLAYKKFKVNQDKYVVEYAKKAGKARTLDKAQDLFVTYKKRTFGRRLYEMLLGAMEKVLIGPVTVENLQKFANLMAASKSEAEVLARVAADLKKPGDRNKLLFYASVYPGRSSGATAAVRRVLTEDGRADDLFLDSVLKSMATSAYELVVRSQAKDLPENATMTFEADEEAIVALQLDADAAARVLEEVNASPGKSAIEMRLQEDNSEAAPVDDDAAKPESLKASTQIREPPISERLIELNCVQCGHALFVAPREVDKFFAGFKECPECKSTLFKKFNREKLWFEYLGSDSKKSNKKSEFEESILASQEED